MPGLTSIAGQELRQDTYSDPLHSPVVEPSGSPKSNVETNWHESRVIESDVEGTMLFQNALVLVEEGEISLAKEIFRCLVRADSKREKVIYWLTQCELREDNLEEAEKMARVLVKVKPDVVSFYLLADILYRREKDQDSLSNYFEAFRRGLTDESFLFEAYKNVGNILVKLGDFDGADEYYCKAHGIDSRSDTLAVNLGTLHIQKGNLDQAISKFRYALNINGKNDKAWVGLALIHFHLTDKELAWANIDCALDINSQNKTALQLMLSWAETNSQWEVVEERLKSYLGHQSMDAEVSFALAKVLYRNGKQSEARLEFERAIHIEPTLNGADVFAKIIKKES